MDLPQTIRIRPESPLTVEQPGHRAKRLLVNWLGAGWLSAALQWWFVLGIALSIKTLIEPRLHTVYTAFAGAARDWWSGHSLYVGRDYFYSPTFALAMTPFGLWSDRIGGILWSWACIALLVYSLRVFYRDVLTVLDWPARAEGIFLLLVLVGSMRSFWSSQSNALVSALVLLGAAAAVRGRWWRAAFWLAAPVHVKVWPLVAGGLFAAQWPKRMAARLAVCVFALGMVPFLTQSPDAVAGQFAGWYRCLAKRQTHGSRYSGYRDAWTIWEEFHTPVDRHQYLLLQMGAGLAVLGWCLWQRRRGLPTAQLVMYTISAWSVWQLFCGPGTERLTYNLIAPAMAWGLLTSFYERRGRTLISLAAVATYLFSFGATERLLLDWWAPAKVLEPIGILLFAAWLVQHAAGAEPWPTAASEPEQQGEPVAVEPVTLRQAA